MLPQPWIMSWYKSSVKKHGWRGWVKNLATSNRGMRIGTDVHGLIEGFIKKEQYEANPKYNSHAIADALYDAVNPRIEDYLALEPHLVSNRLRIHGTADVVVRLDHGEGLAIVDWKTGASKSETHPIQLAIYAMCWNEMNPGLQVDRGLIARVDKKTKALNVHIDDYKGLKQYYPVVEALRTIWSYTNENT